MSAGQANHQSQTYGNIAACRTYTKDLNNDSRAKNWVTRCWFNQIPTVEGLSSLVLSVPSRGAAIHSAPAGVRSSMHHSSKLPGVRRIRFYHGLTIRVAISVDPITVRKGCSQGYHMGRSLNYGPVYGPCYKGAVLYRETPQKGPYF